MFDSKIFQQEHEFGVLIGKINIAQMNVKLGDLNYLCSQGIMSNKV